MLQGYTVCVHPHLKSCQASETLRTLNVIEVHVQALTPETASAADTDFHAVHVAFQVMLDRSSQSPIPSW